MHVLILMHIESEGPGTLGDFLLRSNVTFTTLHLYRGDRLPAEPRRATGVTSRDRPSSQSLVLAWSCTIASYSLSKRHLWQPGAARAIPCK